MAITNLTGTKWKLNDDVNVWLDLGVTVGTFNINFTSNGNNYTSFTVDHHPDNNYNFIRYGLKTIVYRRDMPANNGTWTNNNYKVIEITGGTDVTNTTLISWLGSNATQIIESSGPKPFEVGDTLPAGKIKISWDFTGKPIGEDDVFLIISDGYLYIEIYEHEIFIMRDSNNYEIVSADTPGYTIITLTEPRTITTLDGRHDYEEYVGDAFLWEVVSLGYSITFEEYGGTTQTDLTDQTALPDPLPIPTKEGYTFVGWYYESNFQTRAKAGDMIEEDTTLYAKWHTLGSLFTEIADAIREKESSSEPIRDVDFGERINSLKTYEVVETLAELELLEPKLNRLVYVKEGSGELATGEPIKITQDGDTLIIG